MTIIHNTEQTLKGKSMSYNSKEKESFCQHDEKEPRESETQVVMGSSLSIKSPGKVGFLT